ncbi:MAG TPA: hypothetical protein PLM53_06360 [Spirochaetota bacterium]|nr:hypothetical protein [Spirochaetota bacterium]HPC39716.1 hypothetical protein [Spirochaetota bacterium]HPL16816.1 hypothetical protein [Spirochaetota bacterium]HQF07444.1 hypothetical protein [Spirochaetota bacterium]HQH96704.1 hypothetical protein [Spirochaetota bacterium]
MPKSRERSPAIRFNTGSRPRSRLLTRNGQGKDGRYAAGAVEKPVFDGKLF